MDGKHGTDAGYMRHYRAGEKACDPCRLAHNEIIKQRKAAKRARESTVEPGAIGSAAARQLEDALENLDAVKDAMEDCPPRFLALLSKRRQELMALITQLEQAKEAPAEGSDKPKEELSLAEQLQQLRAARAAGA